MIYVDVSIGMRTLCNQGVTGQTMGPDGTLQAIELYGPPPFSEWQRRFQVSRAASLTSGAIADGRTDGDADACADDACCLHGVFLAAKDNLLERASRW